MTLQNALGNIALDASVQQVKTELENILARLSSSSVDMPYQDTPAMPVRTAPQKYIDMSFSQTGAGLLAPELVQIKAGAGMTISQSAGNLVIVAGTIASAEFVARTVDAVNGALTLKEITTLSQRIANNNFFIELVDIIGDALSYTIVNTTTVDVQKVAHGYTAQNIGQRMDLCALSSVGVPMEGVILSIPDVNTIRFTVAAWPASGSGTLSLTGWNKIEILYTGTSPTTNGISFNTRRKGWQNTAITPTINTSASGHMASINVDNGIASLSDKTLVAGIALTNRTAWDANIPLPETEMYLQIRAKNGTGAPATSTTWTIGMIRIEDYIASQVSLVSTRQQSLNNSMPVNITSSATLATTGTSTATLAAAAVRAAFFAAAGIWYDDSSTVLAANATFTGNSRDLTISATGAAMANAATYAQELRVSAESDQAGTLWLEVSRDNVNWRRVKSVATAAIAAGGQYAEIIHRPSWRYARAGFTNGVTLQTRFSIGSIIMAN